MRKPKANPLIVLRIEFDDWAILFDADTGDGYTINPVGVFVWKNLDGKQTLPEIVEKLKKECEDVPEGVEIDCNEFIEKLLERKLVIC